MYSHFHADPIIYFFFVTIINNINLVLYLYLVEVYNFIDYFVYFLFN